MAEQGSTSVTFQFKWTERLTEKLIRWRAANQSRFTGRRNAAIRGFEAFVKETGLQGVLSPAMAKKKWENLKQKHKVLKNPPEGIEIFCQSTAWRWFDLMEEAMNGRHGGGAAVVRPSLLDEEHNAAVPQDFPGGSVVEMGTVEGVGTLEDVLELNGIKVCGEVKDGADMMETQSVLNTTQAAGLYATLLPNCTDQTTNTSSSSSSSSSSRNIVGEVAAVNRKLAELQKERQALERDQAEFDTELISLERDRALLNKDMVTLERDRATTERDRAAVERDRAAVERERAAVERDRAALERDRVFLDRDRAFLERDRACLERDRVFLERAREDLDREKRALLRRERASLETEGTAVDGDPAETTRERELVLQTRFYQRLMAADLAPDQLETRQRLVSLFQKLVEKM